jgi:regulatory protein
LSYRMRSTREIEHYLRQNGYTEEVVSAVQERLERSGILNDTQFATSWIENRDAFRPRSQRLLALELRQKGISEEVIEQSMVKASSDEDLAYRAALKQAHKLEHLEWTEFRHKLSGFLARRGFSYDTISPVVDQVWADLHTAEES